VPGALFQDTRAGKRPYNQDRLGHWRTGEAQLLTVCDGMGGHAHGEIAAQVALEHLAAAFQAAARPRIGNPDLFLYDAVGGAHAAILRDAQRRGLKEAPRTTVVACVVQEGKAWWSHVGDSRLYLIRKGRVHVRTRDHSYVQQLVDAGKIREQAAENHPDKNRLFQCLGGTQAPRVEMTASAALEKDDILLLCSDGLWGPLTERQILMGLIAREMMDALPALIALAEARAGATCDNISVVALQWQELESLQAKP
jgi:serine/threonine protein phosphatase PrpC